MSSSPIRLFVIAVAAAAFAVGCASEEETVAKHVAEAERYQEEGDLRSALVELQSALRVRPKSGELNMELAELLAQLNKPERAAFYYGEAYRLDPTNTEAALKQAPAFYASDPDAARALIEEVLELEPQNAEAHTRMAELKLLSADTEGALASALTATELDPEYVVAHRVVGAVHRSRHRELAATGQATPDAIHEAAIAAHRRAAKLTADYERQGAWFDWLHIALAYADWEGRAEDSMEAFKRAFAIAKEKEDEGGMLAVVRDARLLANRERETGFTRWTLESWVEADPSSAAAWRLLARLEEQAGGSAGDVWARALEGRTDDLVLQAGYVRFLEEKGEQDKALEHLASLPSEVGDTADLTALRVELFISKKDLEGAAGVLAELEAKHPESPLTQLAKAKLALQRDDVEGALDVLRPLAGQVERADVLRQLAVAEARQGNADAAIAAADRAIELAPLATNLPHRVRIRMLARKDDWTGVLRSYRELLRLGLPITADVRQYRLRGLYETGNTEAARRIVRRLLDVERPRVNLVLLYNRYESQTDPERNRDYLMKAVELYPNDFRVVNAAVFSDLQTGRGEAALARLDAYNEKVGRRTMLGLRAQILWALDRRKEAEASIREAFALDPRPYRVPEMLVAFFTELGKQDEALELLEEAREAGTLGAASLWQVGRLRLERGEVGEARARLEEAHAAAPGELAIQNDLAFVLATEGQDLDRAVELARAVKAGRPDDDAVADTLGFVYLKKGLLEPAAFEFRSAIELARVNGREVAEYHYHLGLALKAQGREEDARKAFSEALRIEPKHEAAQQAKASVAANGAG